MNYNEILSKLSSQMPKNTSQDRQLRENPAMNFPALEINNTETVLNNIGLTIQRQGGY